MVDVSDLDCCSDWKDIFSDKPLAMSKTVDNQQSDSIRHPNDLCEKIKKKRRKRKEERDQNGLATFLNSPSPPTGSLISFQLTGNIIFPASLRAITTPRSFLAVVR